LREKGFLWQNNSKFPKTNMGKETPKIDALSAAPENKEAQQVAPQESAVPASPAEGRIRTENRENREGLSQGVNDPEAALRQGLAAMHQPEGAKPEEEDLGTNKGAMDKISDGMQKAFELIQRFMKQIQSMGSSTLRGMAGTLSMLGFKKAAEWLNEMAGADYAELMTAMKKNNLKLAPVSPEDPEAKAKGEAAERGQAQLADRFKMLAQTRGPAFTRELYYSEVVTAWKKKGGNGGKTDITHNDLLDMAVIAQELPATLPGQVAQAPEFIQPLESLMTPLNIMGTVPAKVSVLNKKAVGVQAFSNGDIVVTPEGSAPIRYHLIINADGFNALQFSLRSAQLTKEGLQLSGEASHMVGATGTQTVINYPSRLLAMSDVRAFLEAVVQNPSGPLPVGKEFRFEKA